MGGYSSGRRGGRETCERSLRLDLAKLARDGLVRPGRRVTGVLDWTVTRTGSVIGTVGFEADMRDLANAWLRLHYTITRPDEAPQRLDYRVDLDTTAPHFSGVRWWFRCPVSGRLARVLFRPDGANLFACRAVYKLAYSSQRQTDSDNAVDRSLALRKRLGVADTNTLDMPFVIRPKWMRERTYLGLLAELRRTQELLVGEAARRWGIEP